MITLSHLLCKLLSNLSTNTTIICNTMLKGKDNLKENVLKLANSFDSLNLENPSNFHCAKARDVSWPWCSFNLAEAHKRGAKLTWSMRRCRRRRRGQILVATTRVWQLRTRRIRGCGCGGERRHTSFIAPRACKVDLSCERHRTTPYFPAGAANPRGRARASKNSNHQRIYRTIIRFITGCR
jgi:hypothetical protein